jgi:hypothetical protein
MKTRLLVVLFISLLSVFGMDTTLKAQVHISLYVNIPLAPNVTLSVGTPHVPAPAPDYIWIDGYWNWDYRYRNYVWVEGHWALAPYADAYWIPGYWEYYRKGYRWIDACWIPRIHQMYFGYYNGRYDYYGRPVYYHHYDPREYRHGYAYKYDHNPNHRKKGYNSSPHFNSSSSRERGSINKKNNNPRLAPTTQRPASQNKSRVHQANRNSPAVITRSSADSNNNRQSGDSKQSVNSESRFRQVTPANVSSSSSSKERSSNSSNRTKSSGKTR